MCTVDGIANEEREQTLDQLLPEMVAHSFCTPILTICGSRRPCERD